MPDEGYEVFISYAHATSIDHAKALEDKLLDAGIRAFRDESSIPYGEPFPERTVAALLGSRVFVAFIAPAYHESNACTLELAGALMDFDHHPAGAVDLGHIVVARQVSPTGSTGTREPDGLDNLPDAIRTTQWPTADETAKLVSLVSERSASVRVSLAERLGPDAAQELRRQMTSGMVVPPPQRLGRIPHYPAAFRASLGDAFVGRDERLSRIDYLLRTRHGGGAAARPPVAIEAGGGFGKTQLAIEYVHRYCSHYGGGIFWIDADTTPERRDEQLHGILRVLEPNALDLDKLRKSGAMLSDLVARALAAVPPDKPVLYVVDNLPEAGSGERPEPLSAWCPAHDEVALLITSRRSVSLVPGIETVTLDVLDPEPAVALLTDKVDRSSLGDADWKAIARWVGQLPLALVILNAALRHDLRPAELLALATNSARPTVELKRQMDLLRPHMDAASLRGIAETFNVSYERLDGASQTLVRLIAHLAPDPIPFALLDALGPLAPSAARGALRSRSFVGPAPSATVPYYGQMHRVLADYLRGRSKDGRTELLELLASLNSLFRWESLPDPRRWASLTAAVPHARAILAALDALGDKDPTAVSDKATTLRWRIAATLYAQGDYAAARTLQEQVLDASRRTLGAEHPDTLSATYNLLETLRELGLHTRARELAEWLVDIRTRVLGAEHPRTLNDLDALAISLRYDGELTRARGIQQDVLEARRRILGPDHPDTLATLHELAITFRAQAHAAEARSVLDEVLAARKRVLGNEHPATLDTEHELAITLADLGSKREARSMLLEVLEARQRVLGPDHPDTLKTATALKGL